MRNTDLVRANVENLTAFWSACGTRLHGLAGGGSLYESMSWPGRMWFDYDFSPDPRDLGQLLDRARRTEPPVMIPQWTEGHADLGQFLGAGGFEVGLAQEAMVASRSAMDSHPVGELHLRGVVDGEAAGQWARVASESFGYCVQTRVISGLVGRPGFHLLLASQNDAVVGTGLLVQTGEIAGLHMVGVPPPNRRRGHARQIMFGLLALARDLGCEHATLQASAAGQSLYEQLGFEVQGPIRSYRESRS